MSESPVKLSNSSIISSSHQSIDISSSLQQPQPCSPSSNFWDLLLSWQPHWPSMPTAPSTSSHPRTVLAAALVTVTLSTLPTTCPMLAIGTHGWAQSNGTVMTRPVLHSLAAMARRFLVTLNSALMPGQSLFLRTTTAVSTLEPMTVSSTSTTTTHLIAKTALDQTHKHSVSWSFATSHLTSDYDHTVVNVDRRKGGFD